MSIFKKWLGCLASCCKKKGAQVPDTPQAVAPPPADPPFLSALAQLKTQTVEDAMTPRGEIKAAPSTFDFGQLIKTFQSAGHSRLPIYDDTLDSVYGFVHVKDLLMHALNPESFVLGKILRKVLFVSPSMRLDELLLEMQQSQTHLALIIDEYGGIDGLVTIEDILEELVGDIRDEHEEQGAPLLVKNNPHTYIASGKASIELLEKEIGCALPVLEDENIETIGGYIAGLFGGLPKVSDSIIEPSTQIKFEVIQVSPRTVDRVMVYLPKKKAE